MPLSTDVREVIRPLMGFVAMGVFWGAWSALIPAVQVAVAADDAALGRALLFVAVGGVPAMLVGGRLVDRFGARLLPIAILFFGVVAGLPGLAASPLQLALSLFVVGAASGLMDVVMNARVSTLEALQGRHFMNACHGTFSLTFFLAAISTGLLRGSGFAAWWILAGVALGIALLALVSHGGRDNVARRSGKDAAGAHAAGVWFIPAVLLLGVVVFCAFLSENGLQAWSALQLERTLEATPSIGALGPAVLGLAFAIGRFGGHGLQARLGTGPLVGIGAVLGATGTLAFALAGNATLALIAVFAAGVGISVVGPSALGLVARLVGPDQRGRAVAAVSTIAYTGFFAGPALLGFVSQSYGLVAAISTIAGFCLLLLPPWVWLLQRAPVGGTPVAEG